ncbi:MAG: class I SAM-dependent methyltransferase [Planctomycetota bacterium]
MNADRREWNAKELANRYQDRFGIDVVDFLNGERIELDRCSRTGVWRFSECLPGDGKFYESLERLPFYYMDDKWEFGQTLDLINGWESFDGSSKPSILEVGCGSGAFLRMCRASGFENLAGLELNEQAIEKCQAEDLDVQPLMTNQLVDRGVKFDCVLAFQVLEHVPEPDAFLDELWQLTNPGGFVVVSTPNMRAFPRRFQWDLLDLPPHHMSRFDESSYRTLASCIGAGAPEIRFEPLARYHHNFFIDSLLDHMPRRSLRRRLLKHTMRLGMKLNPWSSKIRGHSMMAVYRKPISLAAMSVYAKAA